MARYDARQIQKRSTVPGAVPTVAPSNNHLDGTWGVNDIYEGELFINIPDQKIFMRCATNIIDITATIAGITTASNGLTLSGSDVKLGGTLTGNTAINGAFNFNIGNVTPVTSYNVTSSGTISLTNLSNSQVSLGLNLTLTSVGAKVQIISQTNTEISTGGVLRVNIDGSGGITIPQFAGVGDRTLGVDSTGKLKIVAGGGGGISLTDLSAVNGITYNNTTGQFKLGGTLTEDTTIDGDANTYSFTFGSLNNFNLTANNNVNLTANATLNLTGLDANLSTTNGNLTFDSTSGRTEFRTNGVNRGSFRTGGAFRVENLNGTGNKYIGADINGDLITMSAPLLSVANVGSIGSGIFRDITGSTINLYNIANAGGIGVSINATDNTIELLNQHVNIADMNDTFFGTLATNDFIRWDGTAWVNSQLKTINSNSIIGSGNISVGDVLTTGSYANPSWITSLAWSKITSTPTTLSGYGITDAVISSRTLTINGVSLDLSANRSWTVGDVLIGGNTVASTMLIGTNSNFGLQLETNTVVRQTIDNDGLVTFNGTSGNAGIVRMRRLDILDNDNVTWRNALFSNSANSLQIGSGFTDVTVNAALTVTGNITGQANIQSNTFRNRIAGTLLQIVTLNRSGANTDNIYLKTGDDASGAFLSGSILLDTGTTVGGTRGGVAFFNGSVAPTWNSLQRGIFVGNVTAIPTGNPTAGFYMYGNSGVPTFWNVSGNVVKLETRPAVTSAQGIADALTNLGFLASSTISSGVSGINRLIELRNNATATLGATASTDYIQHCTGTNTLTLPTAVGNTNLYTFKYKSGTTTINTTSSQTIDGSTSIVMTTTDQSITVYSDGSNWNII